MVALVPVAPRIPKNATSMYVLKMMMTACGGFGVLGAPVLRAVVEEFNQKEDTS